MSDKPHEDQPQKVPGPDLDISEHVPFGLRYLSCSQCANIETFKDNHGMLTYLCHSKGEMIMFPHSKEICEGFLPSEENMYIGHEGGM